MHETIHIHSHQSSHLFFHVLLIFFDCSTGLISKLIITVAEFSKQNKRTVKTKQTAFRFTPQDLNTKRVFADEKRITVSRTTATFLSLPTQQE
jgi:uncharacterized membrane protein